MFSDKLLSTESISPDKASWIDFLCSIFGIDSINIFIALVIGLSCTLIYQSQASYIIPNVCLKGLTDAETSRWRQKCQIARHIFLDADICSTYVQLQNRTMPKTEMSSTTYTVPHTSPTNHIEPSTHPIPHCFNFHVKGTASQQWGSQPLLQLQRHDRRFGLLFYGSFCSLEPWEVPAISPKRRVV